MTSPTAFDKGRVIIAAVLLALATGARADCDLSAPPFLQTRPERTDHLRSLLSVGLQPVGFDLSPSTLLPRLLKDPWARELANVLLGSPIRLSRSRILVSYQGRLP
ncbi:MAG TPA: hypothetical protein VMT17_01755 [Anaeromyxobacteraceae bacterium]|nr:hypothetical protein [Anaeromyxobacteraceae bacterium]